MANTDPDLAGVNSRGDAPCPDAELLAAYIEKELTAAEHARVQQHLLTCRDCRDVVIDAGVSAAAGGVRQRGWWVVVGTAVAATLIFALWIGRPGSRSDRVTEVSRDTSIRHELVVALAAESVRPVEGRLTGGFHYAPAPTALRGDADRVSPDSRIAAARIEKLASAERSVSADAALGVASLVLGDLDRGVELLEDAVRRSPDSAAYHNDLAAAYIARARWRDRADDWPRAVASAERAIRRDPTLHEPYFNRALALEALHLDAEARAAWREYQQRDPASAWSREAAERMRRLEEKPARGAAREGDPNLQAAREAIEDVVLPRWAAAWLQGATVDAQEAIADAQIKARALAAADGDAMPTAAVDSVRRAQSAHDQATLRALAEGHAAYGEARRLFLADNIGGAAETMERAATYFRRASSPYQWWGPVYRAIVLRLGGAAADASAVLRVIPIASLPADYLHLRGRYHWTRATALETQGRIDGARAEFVKAAALFERGSEIEHFAATTAFAAETDWLLGNPTGAWAGVQTSLATLHRIPVTTRRNAVLLLSAYFALGDGLPETALYFENALVGSLKESGPHVGNGDAFIQRARILARLGRTENGLSDLDLANQSISTVVDPALRDRLQARLRAVRAELNLSTDPGRAAADVRAALDYLQRTSQNTNLPQLLMLSARAARQLGDINAAHDTLHAAVTAFETARSNLSGADERMQAFQEERAAVSELVEFEVAARRDHLEAFKAAERSRAPALLTPDAKVPVMDEDAILAGRGIPQGTAVLYFVTCLDRILTWVVTASSGPRFVSEQPASEVETLVLEFDRAVKAGGDFRAVSPPGSELFARLIAPALVQATGITRLVVIPDGVLTGLPFAVLADADGQPLLQRYVVAVAPSLSSFVTASSRLAGFSPDDVRTFGDGHDPERTGLSRLPLADVEATSVGELYPRRTVLAGRSATRGAFLESHERVVHFAGHAIVNRRFPLFSRLLLAPVGSDDDTAALLGVDLVGHRFETTDVLVLASCDTAAGPFVPGEGVLSLARLFVDAGIPSVIASLWPVDERAHPLLVQFHRELRKYRDPAAALRATQQRALRDDNGTLPVQVWGGLTAVGGVSPTIH
jgi:CHAT domain-containing protein